MIIPHPAMPRIVLSWSKLFHLSLELWIIARLAASAEAGDNCIGRWASDNRFHLHQLPQAGTRCCQTVTCDFNQTAVVCDREGGPARCVSCPRGYQQLDRLDSFWGIPCTEIRWCNDGMYKDTNGRCVCNTTAGYYTSVIEGHCEIMYCDPGTEPEIHGNIATCKPCREGTFQADRSQFPCQPFKFSEANCHGRFIKGTAEQDSQCRDGETPSPPPTTPKTESTATTTTTTTQEPPMSPVVTEAAHGTVVPPVDEPVKGAPSGPNVTVVVVIVLIVVIISIVMGVVIGCLCGRSGKGRRRSCLGLGLPCLACCDDEDLEADSSASAVNSHVPSNIYVEQTTSLMGPKTPSYIGTSLMGTKATISREISRRDPDPREHNDETGSINGSTDPRDSQEQHGGVPYGEQGMQQTPYSPESGVIVESVLSQRRMPSEHSLCSTQSERQEEEGGWEAAQPRGQGHRDSGVESETEHLLSQAGQGQLEVKTEAQPVLGDPPPYSPSNPNTPSDVTPTIIVVGNLQVAQQISNNHSPTSPTPAYTPASTVPPYTTIGSTPCYGNYANQTIPRCTEPVEEECDTPLKEAIS